MFKLKDRKIEFSSYLESNDEKIIEKAMLWRTAIGLQDVDGLKHSPKLIQVAKKHIENKINIDEAKNEIDKYYDIPRIIKYFVRRSKEADMVSVRIVKYLTTESFKFSENEFSKIHKKIFSNVFFNSGKYRDYDFYKNEIILNGDTVKYLNYKQIKKELHNIFEDEKKIEYKNLSIDNAINNLCEFTSKIWLVHPFTEGNTRTTAMFIIKYLESLGYDVNIDVFTNNSWYFRNALVRANYENAEKNVFKNMTFLKMFFYNLISDTNFELKNTDTFV